MSIPRDPILYAAKPEILRDLYVSDEFYELMGVDAPESEPAPTDEGTAEQAARLVSRRRRDRQSAL